MIIQFNWINDSYSRQHGHKMFYHWNDGTVPTNEQIRQLLYNYYMNPYVVEEDRLHNLFAYIDYGNERKERVFEIFPIFTTYVAKGVFGGEYIEFNSVEWRDGWYHHHPLGYI